MIFVIIGIFAIVFSLIIFWVIGEVAYKLHNANSTNPKSILVGLVASIIGGFSFSFLERVIPQRINDDFMVLGYLIIPFVIAYIMVAMFENKDVPEKEKDKETEKLKGKEEEKMNDINIKSLIRIPVWALYSLIVATVIMSFVMLVKIWFPETIDEEIIWRIILSYGVFLVSALVISNLTDKIKTMKTFENEK